MRFLEGATTDAPARADMMQDARSLYIDASHCFDLYGNKQAAALLDQRIETTRDFEKTRVPSPLRQLLRLPQFRIRIN